MFDAISGHGGIINQMEGDGLMAIFGAPVEQPDHPQSAVLAGLEMIELVELFNLEREAEGKVPIKIGVGIATGEVIAGFTGTDRRATYTCVGDTVNLAARLESHTKVIREPILINDATRQALDESVGVEDQGLNQIKGFEKEVRVYSVPVAQGQ